MTEFSFSTSPRATSDGSPLVAHVRFTTIGGNQEPYLSITATGYRRQRLPGEERIRFNGATYYSDRRGCLHSEIAEVFPELTGFLRWHLAGPSGPMHYVANAIYWAELAYGCSRWERRDSDPIDTLKRHVVFGAVEGDTMPAVVTTDDDGSPMDAKEMRSLVGRVVTEWCHARAEALAMAFKRDLEALANLEGSL